MISREAARKAWLTGLRNPHEKKPWAQLPSPTKREFESWVFESYESLHSEIFENRRLKPQYLFTNDMYAYLILKDWKSRIGFGEGKVEDLREVLDYETYFYVWIVAKYREEERYNDWIASSLEHTVIHLNDGELSNRLLEIANETWNKALDTYAAKVDEEEFREWFLVFNKTRTGEKDVFTKFWWVRQMARRDEDFREWFVESGLGREAYRLLEYEDTPGVLLPVQENKEEDEEEDWTDKLPYYDSKGVLRDPQGSHKHVGKRDGGLNYIPPTIRGGKSY